MRLYLRPLATLAVVLVSGCGPCCAPEGGRTPRAFQVIDLRANLDVAGSSRAGHAAGTLSTQQTYHAFLWFSGSPTDLGSLGGLSSSAASVSATGIVAGTITHSTFPYVTSPYVWQSGTVTMLPSLGGPSASANAINDAEQVAGSSDDPTNQVTRAVLWTDGHPQDLGALPGDNNAEAMGLNNNGAVVGQSYYFVRTPDPGVYTRHAFIWENGRMSAISIPGATESAARAINLDGQVVGTCSKGGFLWYRGQATIVGGTGLGLQEPAAINRYGQVVGRSYTSVESGFLSRAMLWSDNRAIDLNDLIPPSSGWILEYATGIDDVQRIVGTGTLNGVRHGFMLQPVELGGLQ